MEAAFGPAKDEAAAKQKPDSVISVAGLVPDNSEIIETFVEECSGVLGAHYRYYEIVLIDNLESHAAGQYIRQMLQRFPNLRYIRLSRRSSNNLALTAALDHSVGDYLVLLELDGDPPSLVPRFIETINSGYDIVIGETQNGDCGWLRSLFLRLAGRVLRCDLRPNATRYRAFSRAAANSMTKVRSKTAYMMYLPAQVGYRQTFLTYEKSPRSRETPASAMPVTVGEIMEMVIANSALPLRLAALFGFAASFLNLLYLGYIAGVVLVKNKIAEGWLTLSIMNTTMFFLLFLILTILAEYVARILDEATDRPLYFIESEFSSTTSSLDRERLNVV
jgi:dolichol-phosphate mannosyltransferase